MMPCEFVCTVDAASVRMFYHLRVQIERDGFGRWALIEVTGQWDAKNTIRTRIQKEIKP